MQPVLDFFSLLALRQRSSTLSFSFSPLSGSSPHLLTVSSLPPDLFALIRRHVFLSARADVRSRLIAKVGTCCCSIESSIYLDDDAGTVILGPQCGIDHGPQECRSDEVCREHEDCWEDGLKRLMALLEQVQSSQAIPSILRLYGLSLLKPSVIRPDQNELCSGEWPFERFDIYWTYPLIGISFLSSFPPPPPPDPYDTFPYSRYYSIDMPISDNGVRPYLSELEFDERRGTDQQVIWGLGTSAPTLGEKQKEGFLALLKDLELETETIYMFGEYDERLEGLRLGEKNEEEALKNDENAKDGKAGKKEKAGGKAEIELLLVHRRDQGY